MLLFVFGDLVLAWINPDYLSPLSLESGTPPVFFLAKGFFWLDVRPVICKFLFDLEN